MDPIWNVVIHKKHSNQRVVVSPLIDHCASINQHIYVEIMTVDWNQQASALG